MNMKPPGAGKSSFDLLAGNRAFELMALEAGSSFLDLACGFGRYSLFVADLVGPRGQVHALDLWEEGILQLQQQAAQEQKANITALVGDIAAIPLPAASVDCALLATALHDVAQPQRAAVIAGVHRVLKPGAHFCVIEFKPRQDGPGPPLAIRLAPEDVENMVLPAGFETVASESVGQAVYMLKFSKKA